MAARRTDYEKFLSTDSEEEVNRDPDPRFRVPNSFKSLSRIDLKKITDSWRCCLDCEGYGINNGGFFNLRDRKGTSDDLAPRLLSCSHYVCSNCAIFLARGDKTCKIQLDDGSLCQQPLVHEDVVKRPRALFIFEYAPILAAGGLPCRGCSRSGTTRAPPIDGPGPSSASTAAVVVAPPPPSTHSNTGWFDQAFRRLRCDCGSARTSNVVLPMEEPTAAREATRVEVTTRVVNEILPEWPRNLCYLCTDCSKVEDGEIVTRCGHCRWEKEGGGSGCDRQRHKQIPVALLSDNYFPQYKKIVDEMVGASERRMPRRSLAFFPFSKLRRFMREVLACKRCNMQYRIQHDRQPALLDCGHLVCSECASELANMSPSCPFSDCSMPHRGPNDRTPPELRFACQRSITSFLKCDMCKQKHHEDFRPGHRHPKTGKGCVEVICIACLLKSTVKPRDSNSHSHE